MGSIPITRFFHAQILILASGQKFDKVDIEKFGIVEKTVLLFCREWYIFLIEPSKATVSIERSNQQCISVLIMYKKNPDAAYLLKDRRMREVEGWYGMHCLHVFWLVSEFIFIVGCEELRRHSASGLHIRECGCC